ncbi:MAG: methionine synthase [Lentisphaerae bacterium]|nr:methionine synthase [Lentisphaerota bacterium]MCP4103121.1 methionine synthase [Lentisphaerota bacterium]
MPERKIYSRLGHNRHLNEISAAQRRKLVSAMNAASACCDLKGTWIRLNIIEFGKSSFTLENGTVFESEKLLKLVQGCSALAVFGATAGKEIMEKTSEIVASGDGVTALVYDAVGSETADAAMDWMQNYLNQLFKRSNEHLTRRRFSAGYGDFGLENQKEIYKILDLGKLGVELTPQYLMIPEKTVTAVAGILKVN